MVEVKYGLFTSFILFVWMVIAYSLLIPQFHALGFYIGIFAILTTIVGIFFGIREKRDKTNFGHISFNEAFKTGMIITIITAVLMVLFIYIYYEYINPDYLNFLAAETQKSLMESNAGREEINNAITIVRYQYSLNVQLIQQLLFILIGGTAITTIVSLILKKTRRGKSNR